MHPSTDRRILIPDTHAHLGSAAFDEDTDAVIARATEADIGWVLAVGTNLESSRRAIALGAQYASVFAAVGLDPHEADRFVQERDELRSLVSAPKVVAIGEIGLDYDRATTSRSEQMTSFVEQLAWAEAAKLPVSIHNRGADADVLRAVRESGVVAVMHCFSGTPAHARAAVDAGCYLSFAGNSTFPRAEELREIVAKVPLDRMLVESDAPVLAPQTWRGRRNEPAYVAATVERLAEVRGISRDEMATALWSNAAGVFQWEEA